MRGHSMKCLIQYARTSTYQRSFFLDTIKLWNCLPIWVSISLLLTASLISEKDHLKYRLYMLYMKAVSVRMYTFHNCENYVKVLHDCPTKRDGSSKVPVISRLLKYKLCPPPFVSRVLLSWQLVGFYLYESSNILL